MATNSKPELEEIQSLIDSFEMRTLKKRYVDSNRWRIMSFVIFGASFLMIILSVLYVLLSYKNAVALNVSFADCFWGNWDLETVYSGDVLRKIASWKDLLLTICFAAYIMTLTLVFRRLRWRDRALLTMVEAYERCHSSLRNTDKK